MKASSSKPGAGFLLLFSLPFATVGVFMLYSLVSHVVDGSRMAKWPTVPATLLESELETNHSDGTTYKATARYRYEWEGREYEGTRVALYSGSDNIGSFQKDKAALLRQARENDAPVPAHVNPDNPSESILFPEFRWEKIGFDALFVLVFGGVGFGLLFGSLIHGKKQKARQAILDEHPDEPWRSNARWASGQIPAQGKTGAWVMTGFALFWNAVSSPVLFVFREEFFEKGNKAIAIGLLFPLIGVFLVAGAVYAWMRVRKYGTPIFHMPQVPGVLGGHLQGEIRLSRPLQADHGVDLVLRSARKITTGSGNNRSTRHIELWSDSRHIDSPHSLPSGETRIPVDFSIPHSCEPSSLSSTTPRVEWTLKAVAPTPGVDFEAVFEVPVFHTPDSDPNFVVEPQPIDTRTDPRAKERLWKKEHVRPGPAPGAPPAGSSP